MRNFTFTAPSVAKMQKMGVAGGFAALAAATTFGLAATADQQPAQAAAQPAPVAATTTLSGVTDKAAGERTADTVSRSAERIEVQQMAYKNPVSSEKAEQPEKSEKKTEKKVYPNNLDGWIRESLDIMQEKGIPGTYHGLHKNIIRESSGNPKAINDWDINAINGIPSKGLLQVIPPTFEAYHVEGTPDDIWNPVSNITAAANYAADKYGSIDNVNSAY
ncbi:transglycosylase SLT domain-containing protein [Streptomyces sp. UH6]|uniref:transglycosylase SLT domain-containing protein n=1 Tax=Streptomyces sp. UH6 TaxID=2748379 RepID=UPI0015D4AABD|nr:transglycosylase SLT domain-containing protein [Streptomyces sp. UH6]NYV72881.1 transglycosylase SLT domain-containing protein [Streptomyces sp. UH6]